MQIRKFLQKDIFKIPVPGELGEAPAYEPNKKPLRKGGFRKKKSSAKSKKNIAKPSNPFSGEKSPKKDKKRPFRKSRSRSDNNQTGS